jgi:glycogen debranching enzyme
LVNRLKDHTEFASHFPAPSVPLNSARFNPDNFWQGPTWVNTNWLIIQGLKDYGYLKEAQDLKRHTIKMVGGAGFFEYFSPLDGSGKGAPNFSWTAALTIDLLKS